MWKDRISPGNLALDVFPIPGILYSSNQRVSTYRMQEGCLAYGSLFSGWERHDDWMQQGRDPENCRHIDKIQPAADPHGILQQLYNWADAFIVGNVEGELALAAVGATATVVNFYVTAITGFTLGLAILAAQAFGSGETAALSRILSTFSCFLAESFFSWREWELSRRPPCCGCCTQPRIPFGWRGEYLRIVPDRAPISRRL